MTTLTLTDPVTGTVIDSGVAASNNAALRAVINGSIDNSNISASANVAVSKLAPGAEGAVLGITGGVATWGAGFPAGTIVDFAGASTPTGWLACDGAAVARGTYVSLYAALVVTKGAVTMTLASPGVASFTAHGFVAGDAFFFETTGGLPTGVSADTTYYVIATGLTANAFQFSASRGGAAVNTSVSQSGTHTLFYAPYGVAGSATTFKLPDARGRTLVGYAASGGHADVAFLGADDGVAVANRRAKHRHTPHSHVIDTCHVNPGNEVSGNIAHHGDTPSTASTQNTDGGSGNSNDSLDAPAFLVVNRIVKT